MPKKQAPHKEESATAHRPPVVAVMGHVDHGKSTLLDFIRKTNVAEGEAGGITQRLSAYEVHHPYAGEERAITFLDTPGHVAFNAMRSRGARVADVAILVVSAEDGVKDQTLEAYTMIQEAGIPFIVAINKIDKPGADVERTKQGLAEHSIFVEGYGGTVPNVPISAKTGDGISELLDLVLLSAEMEELHADATALAEGVVIESHIDPRKGTSATLVLKNGSLSSGMFVVAGQSSAPTRMMEDYLGHALENASVSMPVRITGFSSLPPVGSLFSTYTAKKDAERAMAQDDAKQTRDEDAAADRAECLVIPLVIKSDVLGMSEAIEGQVQQLSSDRIEVKIVKSGVGDITENDIKAIGDVACGVVVGLNVGVERGARELAERIGIGVHTSSVIYELTDWLKDALKERTPSVTTEERIGLLKVLKVFGVSKGKQVVGGEVVEGSISRNAKVKILRRDAEIGRGTISDLQQQKSSSERVLAGNQCGVQIETKIEIVPSDRIEAFGMVTS